MISVESYVHRGKNRLRILLADRKVHVALRMLGYILAGFLLSGAALLQRAMPLSMGFVWACSGWTAALAALGGAAGYWAFWGTAGYQGMIWCGISFLGVAAMGNKRICRETPMLAPATAALITAVTGVSFQTFAADTTPVAVFLLRVVLSGCCAWLFNEVMEGRNPILDWIATGLAVLALAQITPVPYLGLGFLAAGALCVAGAFPAAALAGLALDLSQVTAVPMTAVTVLSYLVRFAPRVPGWIRQAAPGCVYLLTMMLCALWDPVPLPGLVLGGIIGVFLPGPGKATHRRGEIGVAQVRLEMAAGVLSQTQQMLMEVRETDVDEDAILSRAAERACSGCPCRKSCRDAARVSQLPGLLLHKPLLCAQEMPIICRKSGRLLAELHRAQEQLRSIRADRDRQREYRAAVVQQYRFASEFLQDVSDRLSRRGESGGICYQPEVKFYGNRPESENGDRCLRFAGTMGKYYVLLCDGMGTGLGAVQEGKTAAGILKKLLSAGYPAEHALRSLNSLCALRERAGAVTVDLAELDLSNGKVALYKWGAAPSYLVSPVGAEKIGTAGPPPGLSVTDCRETVENLSLRKSRTLVMVSDGVGEEDALHCCLSHTDASPGELAKSLIACTGSGGQDDTTVITVRLSSGVPPT